MHVGIESLLVRLSAGVVFAAATWTNAARSAENIVVTAAEEGEFIVVNAAAELPVAPSAAWEVLSDYERYAEFIPDMRSSRVLFRGANGTVVEQKGEFGFLFFRQAVEVRMAVLEFAPRRIVARAISGSFRELAGRYEINDVPGGVRISYLGRLLPDFPLPPFIGLAVVRHDMEKQFSAMIEEIARRDGLERGKAPRRAAQ